MKEITISIEGYNESGICVSCLNFNRTMYYDEIIKQCFRMLGNIDVPDGISICVCWECHEYMKNFIKFREQLLKSYKILIDYSETHSFLKNPEDLTKHAKQRLSSHFYLEDFETNLKNTVPDIKVENNPPESIVENNPPKSIIENNPPDIKVEIPLVAIKEEDRECMVMIKTETPDLLLKTESENLVEEISMYHYDDIPQNSQSNNIVLFQPDTENIQQNGQCNNLPLFQLNSEKNKNVQMMENIQKNSQFNNLPLFQLNSEKNKNVQMMENIQKNSQCNSLSQFQLNTEENKNVQMMGNIQQNSQSNFIVQSELKTVKQKGVQKKIKQEGERSKKKDDQKPCKRATKPAKSFTSSRGRRKRTASAVVQPKKKLKERSLTYDSGSEDDNYHYQAGSYKLLRRVAKRMRDRIVAMETEEDLSLSVFTDGD